MIRSDSKNSTNSETHFIHSIKVPRLYKDAADIIEKVIVKGGSLKEFAFKGKHPNVSGIYGLASTAILHNLQLDELIKKSKILVDNPQLNVWLAKVLITELLWRKQFIRGESKPVITVNSYEEKLRELLLDSKLDPSTKKVEKPRYVRINTLLMSMDEALQAFWKEGWKLLPKCPTYVFYLRMLRNLKGNEFIRDFHIPELLAFPSGTKFHDHPGYINGKMILQDKASCIPPFLLNPKPGATILDMCAAPGMKTTQLASIIEGRGTIYALEKCPVRFKTLENILHLSQATCVEAHNVDALSIAPTDIPGVQYILLDPSCSGSGMIDRINPAEKVQKIPYNRLLRLKGLQSAMLRFALQCFPNVKRVVYSTCSIYQQENEQVVAEALQQVGNAYTLLDAKQMLWNEWINVGSPEFPFGHRCIYSIPTSDLSNGFFVAAFERNFDVPLPPYSKLSKAVRRALLEDKDDDDDEDAPKVSYKVKDKASWRNPTNVGGATIKYNWRAAHQKKKAMRKRLAKQQLRSGEKMHRK